jgi:hypothetical protein
MFAAPSNNPYGAIYYGTAAGSRALFGESDWLGSGCGSCYKLTGTSNVNQVGVESTIVVKIANLCPEGNSVCSGGKVHFDIAAPGFDFAASSLSNTCNSREVDEAFGFNACGNTWPAQDCNCGVFNDPVLEAGCNNFKSLNWNNVPVRYEAVACPSELDRLNCWEENGGTWPPNNAIPEFCAANLGPGDATPTAPTGPAPTSPVAAPTNAPISSPVALPSPTPAPVSPTNAPVRPTPAPVSPTNAPVRPTPAPVSPTNAPVAPTTPSGDSCCSLNYKDCVTWCPIDEAGCNSCNSGQMYWLANGSRSGNTCLARWDACTTNPTGCCGGLVCRGNKYYRQCVVP